ncbi:hypothetical protein [Nostoc sp.]|uniref:hypothetical protein n=1 Tax=Nostoc sp. TaxID=1180 RepID=UPI003593ABFE
MTQRFAEYDQAYRQYCVLFILGKDVSYLSYMFYQGNFVSIDDDGKFHISVESVQDAKIAIKELKLKKKEYALVKREISQQQKVIRAKYTENVRQRGSKIRGGGGLGQLIRTVQTSNRDADRRALAQELAPLEQ